MSHRTALAASVALTLLLAAGVIIGRDRLFTAEAAVGTPVGAPAPAEVVDGAVAGSVRGVSEVAPHAIEIPLPANQEEPVRANRDDRADGDERARFDDDDHDDDHDDHDDYGEDDDD
jgi:hypothetical protein